MRIHLNRLCYRSGGDDTHVTKEGLPTLILYFYTTIILLDALLSEAFSVSTVANAS